VQLFSEKHVFVKYNTILLKHHAMRKSIILTVFVFGLTITTGLAIGKSEDKETRDIKGFTKVSFGVSGNMYINIAPEFKVVLEGDKSVLQNIVTEVSGGRLIVKQENWKFNFHDDRITVYITMPEISGLGVSGSGRAEIKDAVKTDDLSLSVSGSGKIYTNDVAVNNLKSGISGSGDIIVGGGNAAHGNISISGSGNYFGENAKIASVDISISGSGNCAASVTESLKASVSGSGNVTYSGNPRIDARVSGSGKVRSR
jgi:hypothetical protein